MRVWIDLTNSPHVLVMRPVIEILRADGHEVRVTARDFAQTLQLLDRFAIDHTAIGRHRGERRGAAGRPARCRGGAAGWRDAARRFWEFTSAGTGMPRQLVIACGEEELVLGAGSSRYFIGGDAEKLSRVLTGTDVFLDEVYAGSIAVRGTMTQLSVMAGAAMKVRFHG